jgi:hypothetical protein
MSRTMIYTAASLAFGIIIFQMKLLLCHSGEPEAPQEHGSGGGG